MTKYILGLLLEALVTLFLVSVIVFLLVRTSGSPVDLLVPMEAGKELIEEVTKKWGLDKPVHVQYYTFISRAVRGDLGKSLVTNRPVIKELKRSLPISGKLALVSVAFALAAGIPLGILAAVKRGGALDGLARIIAVLGQATPSFWLGLVLIFIFSARLKLFPVFGAGTWKHFVLPAFVTGWFIIAGITRILRSSMLEILDSDYVKLARIKGVAERRVIWTHALRNALIPMVTFTGLLFSLVVTTSIVVEAVFAYPGFGQMLYTAILLRDFPIIQGAVLAATALVIGVNLFIDILYGYIDPRIRVSSQ